MRSGALRYSASVYWSSVMFDWICTMIIESRMRLSYYAVMYFFIQLMKDKLIMVSFRLYYLIGALFFAVHLPFKFSLISYIYISSLIIVWFIRSEWIVFILKVIKCTFKSGGFFWVQQWVLECLRKWCPYKLVYQ